MITFEIRNISGHDLYLPLPFDEEVAHGVLVTRSVGFHELFDELGSWRNVIRDLEQMKKKNFILCTMKVIRKSLDIVAKALMLYGVVGGAARAQNKIEAAIDNTVGASPWLLPIGQVHNGDDQEVYKVVIIPRVTIPANLANYLQISIWEYTEVGVPVKPLSLILSTQTQALVANTAYEFPLPYNDLLVDEGHILNCLVVQQGAGQTLRAKLEVLLYNDQAEFDFINLD